MLRSLIFFLLIVSFYTNAQVRVVKNPAVAQQTHPEMLIEQISFFNDSTIVQISVINRLAQGGWFCADKNTFLEDPQSFIRRKVIDVEGIPWCPSSHRFTRIGEVLRFKLIFPGMESNPETLNLIEVCDKSCFAFRGIILNEKLNADIRLFDEGMEHYAANRFDEAIKVFSRIVEEIPANPTHVYGYSYYNLIRIFWDMGKKEEAKVWLEQLRRSGLPNSQYFINNLRVELSLE